MNIHGDYKSYNITIPAGESEHAWGDLNDWYGVAGAVITQISINLNTNGIYNIRKEETCYLGKKKEPIVFTPGSYYSCDIEELLNISIVDKSECAKTADFVILGEQLAKMTGFPPNTLIPPNTVSPKVYNHEIGTDILTIGINQINIISVSMSRYMSRGDTFQYINQAYIPLSKNNLMAHPIIYLRDNMGEPLVINSDVHIHLGYYVLKN